MELKHGTVRLDAAAEWLSKTTGRTFTAADLIDAHDKLPICALIPRSKANPKYSGPVQRAMLAKAIEVEIDAEAARKGPLTQREIAEAAKRRLSEGIATRLEIEKTIHEEGIYLLSRRDLHLLARHGVQRLNRGTPFLSLVASRGFQPGLAEAIEFGTPVDVTADMLCVLKGYLVKFAEQVAAQQVETPAPPPDRVREQREPSEAAQADPAIDQGNEIIAIAHGGDTVLVEFWLTGTHLGPLRVGKKVIEPTGRKFRVRMTATFEFPPGDDRILCERPYYDQGAVLRALELG